MDNVKEGFAKILYAAKIARPYCLDPDWCLKFFERDGLGEAMRLVGETRFDSIFRAFKSFCSSEPFETYSSSRLGKIPHPTIKMPDLSARANESVDSAIRRLVHTLSQVSLNMSRMEMFFNSRARNELKATFSLDFDFYDPDSVAFPPDYNDLLTLRNVASVSNVSTIVELGSGFSTQVFADALARGHIKEFTSFEPSKEWADITRARLASRGLDTSVVVTIPRGVLASPGEYDLSFFRESLEESIDFIYIDGPVASMEDGVHDLSLGAEILGIPQALDSVFLIDGRYSAAKYINEHGLASFMGSTKTTANMFVPFLGYRVESEVLFGNMTDQYIGVCQDRKVLQAT